MNRIRMIIVGGFLGAGKTTLLAKAAGALVRRGKRVGLVTNDQAANLVDTELLSSPDQPVQEVSGACFCCAFNRLLNVCDQLIETSQPDVIIGEPVGSCTDLSATVLQPLKKYCSDRYDLLPYSVLVDPARLEQELGELKKGSGNPDVDYIYRKQIEEADLIVLNKVDSLTADRLAKLKALLEREFPDRTVLEMSAMDGAGVEAWLDVLYSGKRAGERVVEVDYETYATGEAAMGWLNAAVRLTSSQPVDWNATGLSLVSRTQAALAASSAQIAHLKILLTSSGQKMRISVTNNSDAPRADGRMTPSSQAHLIVNARAAAAPEALQAAVEQQLTRLGEQGVTAEILELSSFRPGRPNPVHRFDSAI